MAQHQPASIIPDDLIPLLEEQAVYIASFSQLVKADKPWDVDMKIFRELHRTLLKIEIELRKNFVGEDITCVIANQCMYWATSDLMKTVTEKVNTRLDAMKHGGPVPVWKQTSSELLNTHISNMKQLILAVSHDVVLLTLLKDKLGDNIHMLNREFEKCEHLVRILLEDIKEQGHFLSRAMSTNMHLFERCRITRDMIERGEIDEDKLGYSLEVLEKAEQQLDERCRKEMPAYRQRITSIFSHMQEALRDGESTQLTRASRWSLAFTMLGDAPEGFRGQAQMAESENKGYTMMVSAREEELGPSEAGQSALKAAEEAEHYSPEPEPKEKPAPEPKPEPQSEEPPKKKKSTNRMAFSSRRGR